MANLESVVLPLAESRALVEAGIVLDTALRWVTNPHNKEPFVIPVWFPPADGEVVLCPAPALSELLDAIRAKVGNPLEERTIILSQDGHLEAPCCAGARSPQGEYQIAYNDTDLLAAAALLREVSK